MNEHHTLTTEAPAVVNFWNQVYETTEYSKTISPILLKVISDAVAFFGDVKGKKILDLGCGGGMSSLLLARQGAIVTALDISEPAIEYLKDMCRKERISTILPIVGDALTPQDHGPFDFIFGSMILHHVEPFGEFTRNLHSALSPGGSAFFYENSANSKLLMFLRDRLPGRFGMPKHGDSEEHPLSREEIALFEPHFVTQVIVPRMVFVQLASMYIFRNKLGGLLKSIDDQLFRIERFRDLSYRRYVLLRRR